MIQEMHIQYLDSTNLDLFDSISISVAETGQEIMLWERELPPSGVGNASLEPDKLQFVSERKISQEEAALVSAKLRARIKVKGFFHSLGDQFKD